MISSLIISALIVVPQVLVVLMASWTGRSGTKPGPPPASAYRVRRFADQRAVFRFDLRSAASIIVGVQVLDGISATVLGVLTALVTADIPPAPEDEQEAAEAERAAALRAEPELPMPGLASTAPAQVARVNAHPKVDPEAERLRALLTETLRELEELRDLFALRRDIF